MSECLFHVFACARDSDADILKRDLLRSPAISESEVRLSVLWNQKSASIAFDQSIKNATERYLVFTHCDVYFPTQWFKRLEWELDRLSHMDPNWAVAGISAITSSGEIVGRIWDASLDPLTQGVYGKALTMPVPIVSTDEMAFVVRRSSGISFDTELPNFHLYATDIILTAERQGLRSYGLDMPLIHNAKAQLLIGRDYVELYKYMARKWRDRLPVPTTCGTVVANPFTLPFRRARICYKAIFRRSTFSTTRSEDPGAKAIELGLDQMLEVPPRPLPENQSKGGLRSIELQTAR